MGNYDKIKGSVGNKQEKIANLTCVAVSTNSHVACVYYVLILC